MHETNKLIYLLSNSTQVESLHTFKEHTYGVSHFSQNKLNSNELASVSFDTTIKLYDLNRMTITKTLNKHNKGVWTCDYSPTSNHFITGGNDNKIIFWDTNGYIPIQEIGFHQEVIYDVKFSSNGRNFASCSKGVICVWDIKKLNEPLLTLKGNVNIILNFFIYLNVILFR